MNLSQFEFKESKISGIDKTAKVSTNKNSYVELQKQGNYITVVKVVENELRAKVSFNDEKKLTKFLKNINKK